MGFLAQRLVIDTETTAQQVKMDGVGTLVRTDQLSRQVFGFLYLPVFAHEYAVALHRRFPLGAHTNDGRGFELATQKIRQ